VHLFPATLDALLDLLTDLAPGDWSAPSVCAGWTVKDIAQHLLGGEIGILSRKRDQYTGGSEKIESWADLVALINGLNRDWVAATRRLSPRLLCDLLRFAGSQTSEYFASVDPNAMGDPVDWAGPEPAPVWLDLAREYTERWHHQQQIRDAVGHPGLKEPRYLGPVLDAFLRALPHTYRGVQAPDDSVLSIQISGAAGGIWQLRREQGEWHLYVESGLPSQASIALEEDIAWRLFTKGLTPEAARAQAILSGDEKLALPLLRMVSIIG
jgi:uncharacterized protein (TIGR03083 family)